MNRFTEKKSLWLSVAFLLLFSWTSTETFSQSVYSKPAPSSKPFLQDIQVKNENPATVSPSPSSTPLVKKTAKVTPVVPNAAYSALGEVDIPGYTGILVETLDGKPVVDSYSNYAFNPASNVKVATAFAVIKTFGPDYRFPTNVWTDGAVDQTTGTLNGNLYVSGRDPIFNYEHAVAIANELNRFGIRTVSGDLIVTDNFAMNFNGAPLRSAATLASTLDSGKRSSAATKSWLSYLTSSGKYGQVQGVPGVSITGGTYVQPMPSNVRLLFTHESAPLREIVKVTLCYSNNFLAEKLGDMVGGAYAVARIVQLNAGLAANEFILQTSSGLGINRVTPKAQMKLLRTFRNELARYKMTFADVMPVAGIDKGTLENRFDTDFATGSVVGKTGTLGNTDAGVSSLTGEINTKNGKLLFVIFNQKGSVPRFRAFQNSYVSLIQSQFGGPTQMSYNPVAFDIRMAKSRITYPDSRARLDE
ncbi:MAG TPA: D-alanyl-D-alanine carboxypeptidase [Pyrinomonadaceae bacterium]|nr:D-alanyl-D-alanine carboxypeptidase [Pyrinomonadaceae bacterium]